MFKSLLHRAVAHPRLYDLSQRLAGADVVRRRLGNAMRWALGAPGMSAKPLVLDIGGGTGAVFEALSRSVPRPWEYLLLDIDPLKVRGFQAKHPGHHAIIGDAGALPLADGSVDLAVCALVAHHLDDALLERLIAEAWRVLRPSKRLVFLDGLMTPRWISRALWSVDRGSRPRPLSALQKAVAGRGITLREEIFQVLHRYYLTVVEPGAGKFYTSLEPKVADNH